MKITEIPGSYLHIDFEKENSPWTLVVIDDKWDTVSEMVCDRTDTETSAVKPGLGARSVVIHSVETYWLETAVGNEIFEKALLLLPHVVHGADGYSHLIVTKFPNNQNDVKALPIFARHLAAFLIDQFDDGTKEERLQSTWKILDAQDFAQHVRARFTRGGLRLPTDFDKVKKILKEPPEGDVTAHVHVFHSWLQRVRGSINPSHFWSCTEKDECHKPSKLSNEPHHRRVAICNSLLVDDPYGVWRWCSEAVMADPLPSNGPQRWFAGKAFNSWEEGRDCPVAAVVAICEGARYLRIGDALEYEVSSDLNNMEGNELDYSLALGKIVFAQGTYHAFGGALRDWLTAPEQFDAGNAQIQTIRIERSNGFALVKITYRGTLPDSIFFDSGERLGRTRGAWQRLKPFANRTSHANENVELHFAYEP